MSTNETVLAIIAAITVLSNLLSIFVSLRSQSSANRERKRNEKDQRYRSHINDVKDAAHHIMQLRHISILGEVSKDIPNLVSLYLSAHAKMQAGAIALQDDRLNDAVANFLTDERRVQQVSDAEGLATVNSSVARGELQLSYIGILVRCNELAEH